MVKTEENNEKLVFFGKITASISHELNNVFSILNEYSGFIEDVLSRCNVDDPIYDKLSNIQNRLTNQVNRGTSIIKKMNMFAHTVDHEVCDIDLSALISNFTELYKRLAEQKRISIKSEVKNFINICSNPLEIELALFNYFNFLLENMKPSSTITVYAEEFDLTTTITIAVNKFVLYKEIIPGETSRLNPPVINNCEIDSINDNVIIKLSVLNKI